MPSNFHLLILIPEPPWTFMPRESHVVHISMSQLSTFPSFSTGCRKALRDALKFQGEYRHRHSLSCVAHTPFDKFLDKLLNLIYLPWGF